VSPVRTFDHIDQHVRSIDAVRAFYDTLLREFGFRGSRHGDAHVYIRVMEHKAHEAFALIEDPAQRPNRSCVAFRAESPEVVDRVAALLSSCGALDIEGPMACPEYTPSYYAVFFTDPEGNRLEVAYR
jgi:hypothetical protein